MTAAVTRVLYIGSGAGVGAGEGDIPWR